MTSRDNTGNDLGLVVAAVWMVVVGAWIAQAGGFAIPIVLVLVLTGIFAAVTGLAMMRYGTRARSRSRTSHR